MEPEPHKKPDREQGSQAIMGNGTDGKKEHWASKALIVLNFVIAGAISFAAEQYAEHVLEDKNNSASSSLLVRSIFRVNGAYQWILTSGSREPIQKFTVLIDLNPAADRTWADLVGDREVCSQRKPLADLIQRIAEAAPAVIVIDKTFPVKQCPRGHQGTSALKEKIEEISMRIPMVIGRRIDKDEWKLEPALSFTLKPGGILEEGLLSIHENTIERVPLQWGYHPEDWPLVSNPLWVSKETLSLKAAELYDPRFRAKHPQLAYYLSAAPHPTSAIRPYISFIKSDQLAMYRAGEVLCGRNFAGTGEDGGQTACDHDPTILRDLHGKVVIIGDGYGDGDKHMSPVLGEGRIDGYRLQANYIEALLDQRYFRPASQWLEYGFGLAIYLLILYGYFKERLLLAFAVWGLVIGIAYAVLKLAATHFGYYIQPAGLSVLGLIILVGHLLHSTVIACGKWCAKGFDKLFGR